MRDDLALRQKSEGRRQTPAERESRQSSVVSRHAVPLILLLGLGIAPAAARDVLIEVEVLHVAGRLAPAEVDAMLADERLSIEAHYDPTRLIEGVTARRERTLPIGSKLFSISQYLTVPGAQVERKGRLLRFRLPQAHPEHPEYYRLNSMELLVPGPSAQGRRPSDTRFHVMNARPQAGAHETARLVSAGDFELGMRVRHRWSDAKGETVLDPLKCDGRVQSLGDGRYRFRQSHRLESRFRGLASTVQSDPPSRPPAGQRSFRMAEPYPEPLAAWQMMRNHLVQLQVDGEPMERLSVYAGRSGAGQCRRTRQYEALFAGGRLVALQRSFEENECKGDTRLHEWVEASWLEDGSLASYLLSTQEGARPKWDGFLAATPGCGGGEAPPAGELQALTSELQRIRAAFLRSPVTGGQ